MSEIGIAIFLIGVIWFIFLSFKRDVSIIKKFLWAGANLFFNPIAGIGFYLLYKSGLIPMILCIVGFILVVIGGIPLR